MQFPCHESRSHKSRFIQTGRSLSSQARVTTEMTLDASGTGMTLTRRGRCQSPHEVNDWDFVSVGSHRGCDTGNTGACLFGSTLALHSIELWAARSVARALQQETEEGKCRC